MNIGRRSTKVRPAAPIATADPEEDVQPATAQRDVADAEARAATPLGHAARGSLLGSVPFYIVLVVGTAAIFAPLPREVIGGLAIVVMLCLLLMRVPVAVAMGVPGALGILALAGMPALLGTFRDLPYRSTASWSFSVLPMFIFMGLLLWRSGITERLYGAGRQWLSWLPGGLAVGTNAAGGLLGAVSGSTLAVTYALGRIAVPEMLRAGYDRRMATGAVLMAGTGGQLLPPSIMAVIYAGIVAAPVGPQLMAGVVPGVLLIFIYTAMIIGLALVFPKLVGRDREETQVETSWRLRWQTLAQIWPVPILMVIVIGGLYAGVFTATEAGAVGALGALLLTLHAKRRGGFTDAVKRALVDAASSVGAIFFLIIGAMLLNRLLTLSGAAGWMAGFIQDAGLSRVQFLLAVLVIYLILGMFMDPLTIMLLLVPILLPVLRALEISVLWFGAFAVLLGELAVITPPVGVLTFIVHRLVQSKDVRGDTEISLGDVFQSVLWFVPATVGLLVLMIFFPQLVEWLPAAMAD